jgi:hypothetical protein
MSVRKRMQEYAIVQDAINNTIRHKKRSRTLFEYIDNVYEFIHCPICLNIFECKSIVRVLPCQHVFCYKCITQYTKNTCPFRCLILTVSHM